MYGAVSANVMISVRELGEIESGQMMSEKWMYIYAKQYEIMDKIQLKGSIGQLQCFCKGTLATSGALY